jgi:O-antigen ligase
MLGVFRWVRAKTAMGRLMLSLFVLFNLYHVHHGHPRRVLAARGAQPAVHDPPPLNPVHVLAGASLLAVLFFGMNFVVSQYSTSGDLFERLGTTKVVHGVVPEAREAPWANAWARALVHPILGQGPFYGELPGYRLWWPHNLYLFVANIIGFPGLFFFLAFLGGLAWLLRPTVDDLQHASYADAYLLVARTQLMLFCLNELKIDFLRNSIYTFQVWMLFGTWSAAYLVSREHGVFAGQTAGAPLPSPEHQEAA